MYDTSKMIFSKSQYEDLKKKLIQVSDVIGFPTNQETLEDLKTLNMVKDSIDYDHYDKMPYFKMDLTNINRSIELFEKYLKN